jgi:hypothetical protein
MLRDRSAKTFILFFLICVLCFCTGACNGTLADSTQTPSSIDDEDSDQDQNEIGPIGNCPKYATKYILKYSHHAVLDIDPGTGETFYMVWENIPPSDIYLWIDEENAVTIAKDQENINVQVDGEAHYPDNKNCSVQNLFGVWNLRTDLRGECANGMVDITVSHQWINSDLESSCGEISKFASSISSAPEHHLFFNLADEFPAAQKKYGEGTMYEASFSYHFVRDKDFIEVQSLLDTD